MTNQTSYRAAFCGRLILCCLFLAPIAAEPMSGQRSLGGEGGGGQVSGGAYYDFSAGSGFAMDVNVWGSVNAPGKYRVPATTKLVQLISYAGGPTSNAKLDEVKLLHDLTVDSTIGAAVVIYDLERYQQTADTSLNPILYPNDTVIIPAQPETFSTALGIVRDIGLVLISIVSLYATISGL